MSGLNPCLYMRLIATFWRNALEWSILVVVFIAHFLKVSKIVLRCGRSNYGNDLHVFLSTAANLAQPRSLAWIVLHGEKSLRPYEARNFILRQNPYFMVLRKVFQSSSNGKTQPAPQRLRLSQDLIWTRMNDADFTTGVCPPDQRPDSDDPGRYKALYDSG